MIQEKYFKAYNSFIDEELKLSVRYNGFEYTKRLRPYYRKMREYIQTHKSEFILFKDSKVKHYEMEFVESVDKIRNKLLNLAELNNIPKEILFIPRARIEEEEKWEKIINIKVEKLIRLVFDKSNEPDFETLRLYNAYERNSPIARWTARKNGKNFLFEFQVSEGIRSEFLIKKRLYLFDNEFVRQQMMWMSQMVWIHKEVEKAYQQWEADNNLWNRINHLKRQIGNKVILDESRPEIKFLRRLEKVGLKGRFIHDEQISWQLKFRPDFWFVNENLIVEYDEVAHKSQVEEDKRREKIITKYLPNVKFIRIKEGSEDDGLREVFSYLKKFNS